MKLLNLLSELFTRVRGPGRTVPIPVDDHLKVYRLYPDVVDQNQERVWVESIRFDYRTTFPSWWAPPRLDSVFHVRGQTDPGLEDKVPPAFFHRQYYPRLCGRMFLNSEYPHLQAIYAFLDRDELPLKEFLQA